MLTEYGTGWRNAFEKKLISLTTLLPDIIVASVERDNGMLRVDFSCQNDELQFIADCVAYKIQRLSAIQCENCATRGLRRVGDDRLPVLKCLCTTCYALELDKVLTA